MRILDLVFRLMLALAVLAGMAFALVATTQSAHAYGAVATYSLSSKGPFEGKIATYTGTSSYVAIADTQAKADADVLALCNERLSQEKDSINVVGNQVTGESACVVSERFQNICAATTSGATRTPNNRFFGGEYLGKSPMDGELGEAAEASFAACMAAGHPRSDCHHTITRGFCDSTCVRPQIPKRDFPRGAGCEYLRPSDCIGNTPILDATSRECRARQASDCTGETPVLDATSLKCRAARQADCTGTTPILHSGICRARLASDCTGGTPVLDATSRECRAATQADCTGTTPILDSGSCRARQASDCTGGTPVLDATSRECRVRQQSDCTGGTPVLDAISRECRARQQSDCTGGTPVLDAISRECRVRQQSDCTGNTPILDSGSCRARQPGDCSEATPVLDSGSCRARKASDCTGSTPIFEGSNCRARQQSDCTGGTPILDGGSCRARKASDCTGNTPILESGSCRARQQSDCDGTATPILAGNICRARVDSDCTGNTPILDNGNCRARQQSDCTGDTPILDGGSCRARQASDCTGNTPILDSGDCRARQASDCTGGTPIFVEADKTCRAAADQAECTAKSTSLVFDGGMCRDRIASDCTGGTPILDNGVCRAAIQSDCTGATPRLFEGRCAAALSKIVFATPIITVSLTLQSPSSGNCNNDGIIGSTLNVDKTACLCPSGKTLFSDGNVNACADPLPTAAARFLANDCTSAGWLWGYTADPTGRFRQDCLVPSRIVDAPPLTGGGGGVNRPASVDALQVSANSDVDACVISRHAGFDATAARATDHPECNDQNLFASLGFPQKPADITHADILAKSKRITVQLAAIGAADATPNIVYNNTTLAHYSAPSGGGGGGGGAGIAIGVAAVVGLLAIATWSGDSDSFTFSPDVGLNYDSESGHILRYGSRVDFRENAWHAWWSAAQTNSRNGTGELRYGSGAEYAGEFWNARLKSDAYGEKSDSAFSLSAEKELGVWSFVPLYRVQYAKDETDESWRHSLTLKAVWRVNQWTLTNSAGFYGKSLAAFGDNASAKILLRRDF